MPDLAVTLPERPTRNFLPEDLAINTWQDILPFFESLDNRDLDSRETLEQWLQDSSELEAVLEEDLAWRYIRMNIDTRDEALAENFHRFIQHIEPEIAPYSHRLNQKLVASPALESLDRARYGIHLRKVAKNIEIYREENIPLFTDLQTKAQEYGKVVAGMMVELDGEQVTMQQAAKALRAVDRNRREAVFHRIYTRRKEDGATLNDLFSELIRLRHEVAKNAGFANFRDYKFASMGRFDYTVQDCHDFHASIREEVVPIINDFHAERKQALGLEHLRPWDLSVDVTGQKPLEPFATGEELIDKTIRCFHRIRPSFGEYIEIMRQMGHLDLESKPGKAPGGFNYPLYEIGVPFIYMNAVGSFQDVVTMVHEGGHAIHSFVSRTLPLTAFKSLTSEIAELASMSMELISMEHWDVFYPDPEDLRRARKDQLKKVIDALPWIALIDKFQHWIYEHPEHTAEERQEQWLQLHREFSSEHTDWDGLEAYRKLFWQKQLHLFEVPFYYIEYGMAQLGAIAVWRNYKRDPETALDQYEAALRLGYTKSIGEIYRTAGISFDFSQEYVRELASFVREELAKL